MSKQIYPRNAFSGSDDERKAGAIIMMVYVTNTISNAYIEEIKEILENYGRYNFDIKHETEQTIKTFDKYVSAMQKYLKGEKRANEQITEVYEVVKSALDKNVLDALMQYEDKYGSATTENNKQ